MRALQGLVVVMGVMLVVGFGVLVITVAHRMAARAVVPEPVQPDAVQPAAVQPTPVLAHLALPQGARIDGLTSVGDHVELLIGGPGGRQWLMLVDPASGVILRTVAVEPVAH